MPRVLHTKCARCDHFVEPNGDGTDPMIASYVHLDDGEKDHDHDALPGQAARLAVWKIARPDLFREYADGKIGPNSDHFIQGVRCA